MEQEQYSREQIIIIIVLCLLLHVVFLSLFFVFQHQDVDQEKKLSLAYDKKMEQLLEKQTQQTLTEEEKKELFEWVAGQAKGNASVVFENEPIDEQGEPDGKDDALSLEKADRELAGADAGKEEEIKEQLELTQAQPQPIIEKQQKQTAPEQELPEPRHITAQELTTITTAADLISMAKDNPSTSFRENEKQEKKQQTQTTPQQTSEPAKKLTLADITKGLVQKIKNNSDHLVNALSEKTGVASAEQIKYERYLKKLEWHISNSDRIHRRDYIDNLASAKTQPLNNLKLYLALNRDGSISELELITSCGIKVIDDYFLFIFRDASTSFPSVPHFLPAPFRCCYLVGLQSEQTAPFRFTIS